MSCFLVFRGKGQIRKECSSSASSPGFTHKLHVLWDISSPFHLRLSLGKKGLLVLNVNNVIAFGMLNLSR